MKRELMIKIGVFCALVSLTIAVRLISETPNFSAVAAATLFAGFYFRSTVAAIALPLVTMTISDQFLGGYTRGVMIAVYVSLLVPIAWRSVLRSRLTPSRVGLGAVVSSVTFYLLTNLAVWYCWYPPTWADLTHCYAIALPFFFNTAMSDLLFSAGFFGLYALAHRDAAAPAIVPACIAA